MFDGSTKYRNISHSGKKKDISKDKVMEESRLQRIQRVSNKHKDFNHFILYCIKIFYV